MPNFNIDTAPQTDLNTDASGLVSPDANSDALTTDSNTLSSIGSDVRELILIDESVADYQRLFDGFSSASASVHVLKQATDGISQVTDILGQYTGVNTVHFFTQGSVGGFKLGSTDLNLGSLAQNTNEITKWKNSLGENADFLLYGNNIAQGITVEQNENREENFIKRLSNILGVDVAASTDATGASVLGGNWDLEFKDGTIESNILSAPDYAYLLDEFSAIKAASLQEIDNFIKDVDVLESSIEGFLGSLQNNLLTLASKRLPLVGSGLSKLAEDFFKDSDTPFNFDVITQTITDFRESIDVLQDSTASREKISKIDSQLLNLLETNVENILVKSFGLTADLKLVQTSTNSLESFTFDVIISEEITQKVSLDIGLSKDFLKQSPEISVGLDLNLGFQFGLKNGNFDLDFSREDDLKLNFGIESEQLSLGLEFGLLEFSADLNPIDYQSSIIVDLTEIENNNFSIDAALDGDLKEGIDLNIKLATSLGNTFPSFEANLIINWQPGEKLSLGQLDISLQDLQVDVGSVVNNLLKPVGSQLQRIFQPLEPLMDFFSYKIPGTEFGLPELVELAGVVMAAKAAYEGNLDSVKSKVEEYQKYANDIRTFLEYYEGIKAFTEIASSGKVVLVQEFDFLDFLEGESTDNLFDLDKSFLAKFDSSDLFSDLKLDSSFDALSKIGVRLPILTDPTQVFNLFLGKSEGVNLFEFNLKLDAVDAEIERYLLPSPIWPIPPVYVGIGGEVTVDANFIFGYDAYGFITKDFRDGFYIGNQSSANLGLKVNAVGAVGFDFGIAAATLDVELGLDAGISVSLKDPNKDGKIRFDEIEAIIAHNPICLFTLGGRVGLIIGGGATFKIGFVEFNRSITFLDITLVDFKSECEDADEPNLATQKDGKLTLNMGSLAGNRNIANKADEDEVFKVEHIGGTAGNETVRVSAFGITQDFENVTSIEAAGGKGRDTIDLTGVLSDSVVWGDFKSPDADKNPDPNYVTTDDGDDKIYASNGTSYLYGGGGKDFLSAEDFNELQRTGSAYIYGGNGNDEVRGGSSADYLYGNSGNDTIFGYGSSDEIDGGADSDLIRGGDGDDTLRGGSGADIIEGDSAPSIVKRPKSNLSQPFDPDNPETYTEELIYHVGRDTIWGGEGDDVISGGAETDAIYGDEGEDIINGGMGDDFLYGGAGNDIIIGDDGEIKRAENTDIESIATINSNQGGKDTIEGNEGNDIILGGFGNDTIDGNDGLDILLGDNGTVVRNRNSGEVNKIFDHSPTNGDKDAITGGAGDDTIFGGIGNDDLTGNAGNDKIYGEAGVDTIYGNEDNDTIEGGLDGDFIYGNAGNDTIYGNAGDDKIYGGTGIDTIYGNEDNDTIEGGLDGDFIYGNAGNDTIYGNAGDDKIYGDAGVDTIYGNEDNDTIEGGLDGDLIYGGSGNDVISGNTGNDKIYGEAGIDTIYGNEDNDTIEGGLDGDFIYGNTGNDTIYGNAGDDKIYGEAGLDIIYGNEDDDTIEGGLDGDFIYGGSGNDTIRGNEGNDLILGESEDDVIYGDTGEDKIYGNSGNDLIFGGTEADQIFGGLGSDEIYGEDGLDILFGDNGDVTATTIISTDINGANDFIDGGNDQDIIIGGAADDTLIGGLESDIIIGDHGEIQHQNLAIKRINTIFTNSGGNDTIQGNEGDDVVLGGFGNDTIEGNDGLDILLGDNGTVVRNDDSNEANDIFTHSPTNGGKDGIIGGAGDDIILGGTSDDTLIGNTGNDTIIGDHGQIQRNSNDVIERITTIDSEQGGNDIIQGNEGDDIVLGGFGNDTIEGNDGLDILLGDNGTVVRNDGSNEANDIFTHSPTNGGKDSIIGGAGDDIILGGTSDDNLIGNTGNDTIIGDHGRIQRDRNDVIERITTINPDQGGNDSIQGNEGNDLLIGGFGKDVIDGATGNDIALGDNALVDYQRDGNLNTLDFVTTTDPTLGDADTIATGEGNDLIFGGTLGDNIWAGAGNDLVFGDHGKVEGNIDLTALPLNQVTPPFIFTAIDTQEGDRGGDEVIYGGTGDDIILGQQGGDRLFGEDGDDDLIGGHNVAGGFDGSDEIDGGTGNDVIAGDNASVLRRADTFSPRMRVLSGSVIYDNNGNPLITASGQQNPTGAAERNIQLFDHSTNAGAGTFGNDVIAGGANDDLIFGQLGNDVIQGDSTTSEFVSATNFSITSASDGDDYIEGGGGDDLIFGNLGQDDIIGGSSNLFGNTTASQRPDGKDTIFGGAGTSTTINDLGDTSAIGHARDADVILGDNGNIFRLVGLNGVSQGKFLNFTYDNYGSLKIIPRAIQLLDYTLGGNATDLGNDDLIYGEAGDDVIHGMTGNDVIFGDGQDDDIYGGVGGDRLYGGTGIDGILGDDGKIYTSRNGQTETLYGLTSANRQAELTLPGPFVGALVNITGELRKDVKLAAFGKGSNDVIYGGLGNDFIHAGAGDDAVSGAEALPEFYNSNPVSNLNSLDYDPVTGKFAAYDANNPLTKIQGFFLNFAATDASGKKINDGQDHVFGDLGNDWLVGGTNNDRLFGGQGDDLLNADDNLDTNNGLNNQPDNSEYADGDFAFGGDGRDVLIANTGNDRLFDWIGEYNSFIVPFSPFGNPTIVRSPSPHVMKFLLELGAASGADQSLTEPYGELGLVDQKDDLWGNQNGAPRDPQPGNTAGTQRDTKGSPETISNSSTSPTTNNGKANNNLNLPPVYSAEVKRETQDSPDTISNNSTITITTGIKTNNNSKTNGNPTIATNPSSLISQTLPTIIPDILLPVFKKK